MPRITMKYQNHLRVVLVFSLALMTPIGLDFNLSMQQFGL